MSTFKIVNGEGNLRVEGSVLFNGKEPILGISLLERPLYGTEVYNAIESHKDVPGRFVHGSSLKIGNITDSANLWKDVTDEPVSPTDANYYMKYKIEKTLYSSSKITVDILKEQVTIDLIEPDQYTSSVDLQKVEKKMIQPGISAVVDLSVKYAKGNDIYARDLMFEAFSYSATSLNRTDFISKFGDFTVEYVDGVVRVIPVSKDVTECIISNCVVTYGCQ